MALEGPFLQVVEQEADGKPPEAVPDQVHRVVGVPLLYVLGLVRLVKWKAQCVFTRSIPPPTSGNEPGWTVSPSGSWPKRTAWPLPYLTRPPLSS
jgi:hypothetical protein